jgi:hypothetical protein
MELMSNQEVAEKLYEIVGILEKLKNTEIDEDESSTEYDLTDEIEDLTFEFSKSDLHISFAINRLYSCLNNKDIPEETFNLGTRILETLDSLMYKNVLNIEDAELINTSVASLPENYVSIKTLDRLLIGITGILEKYQ